MPFPYLAHLNTPCASSLPALQGVPRLRSPLASKKHASQRARGSPALPCSAPRLRRAGRMPTPVPLPPQPACLTPGDPYLLPLSHAGGHTPFVSLLPPEPPAPPTQNVLPSMTTARRQLTSTRCRPVDGAPLGITQQNQPSPGLRSRHFHLPAGPRSSTNRRLNERRRRYRPATVVASPHYTELPAGI